MATLEPLQERHLDALAKIEADAGDVHWTRAQFERERQLPMSRFYVLEMNSEIVAYGGFWKVGPEAQITNLVVAPSYRKQGWGKQFLRHLLKAAQEEGCATVTLEVRRGNHDARRLYEEFGFQTVGSRPKAYQNPEDDAALMEKRI